MSSHTSAIPMFSPNAMSKPVAKKSSSSEFLWKKWSTVTRLSDYIVLTIKTTDPDRVTGNIIEIGMTKISKGVECAEYSTFVDSGQTISPRITKITGIADADLADAPVFVDIADDVKRFIGDSLIIGHNVAVGLGSLCMAFDEYGINVHFTYLDTLALSRKAFPKLKDHKLETLAPESELPDGQLYRALDDSRRVLSLFRKICKMYGNAPLMDAIFSCCTPIENYHISPIGNPLGGKKIALVGTFTFPYLAARKLIMAAGGTFVRNVTDDADILVYGLLDDSVNEKAYYGFIERAKSMRDQGKPIQIINELHLLKLCGVIFH